LSRDYRLQILDGARRADLNREPAARLLIAADFSNGVSDAPDRAVVQRAHELISAVAVVRQQCAIDILAKRLHLGGNEIAANPAPDRLERDAGNASDTSVVGPAIDQERFERHKEHSRGIADAGNLLGIGTDGAAQFLEDQVIAVVRIAAQKVALEFLDEQRPGLRRKRPKIFPQPFDGLPIARHKKITVLDLTASVLSVRRLRSSYAKRPEFGH
jgi:hypothetical protein